MYFKINFPSLSSVSELQSDDLGLIVKTMNGKLRGTNLNLDVNAWLGIPYAKAPTGKLRFSKPMLPKSWNGIKDVDKLPNACPQSSDETFGNFSGSQQWNPNTKVSEDCLYLNVYAPKDINANEVFIFYVFTFNTCMIMLDNL